MIRIGVDLGGTKIEGIALDGDAEAGRLRIPTPRNDYDATVRAVASVVHDLEGRAGTPATVGIGIPGALDPSTGLVKNANSVWLNGRPLQADLARALGRDVRIANDANCLAVSEAHDGAAAGAAVVFAAIVGTGTGAGIVAHGRLLTGPNAVAGEWGHNPLPWAEGDEWPGPACYCGKRGCIETFLSGPALAAAYTRRTGRVEPAESVAERAATGDVEAEQVLQSYERCMARALAAVINLLDPDVIVLGGGVSNLRRIYTAVPGLWGQWVFSAGGGGTVRTRLVPARYGDASGVRGAAWLWPDGSAEPARPPLVL